MDRKNFIGSSDIAAAMDMHPFKTPLQLWAEKTGKVAPSETSEAAEWGNRLESVVSKKFSEKHDVKLIAYKKRFVHKSLDYLTCELDRIISGTDELLEVKTMNAWLAKSWGEDEIPPHFILQVNFALGLSGRKKAWLACLLGGQRYIERELQFDQELFDKQVASARDFWENFVLKDTPPMAVAGDAETLVDLYPSPSESIIEATTDVNDAVEHRLEVIKEIEDAKSVKDDIDSKLKQIIGENAGIQTDKFVVTWRPQSRATVDTDALKRDGLFEKYSKLSVTRVLRVAARKEKELKPKSK